MMDKEKRRAYMREWVKKKRLENPDEHNRKRREYKKRHKAKIAEQNKRYYEKHKTELLSKRKEYSREYYKKNREKIIATTKAWYRAKMNKLKHLEEKTCNQDNHSLPTQVQSRKSSGRWTTRASR